MRKLRKAPGFQVGLQGKKGPPGPLGQPLVYLATHLSPRDPENGVCSFTHLLNSRPNGG